VGGVEFLRSFDGTMAAAGEEWECGKGEDGEGGGFGGREGGLKSEFVGAGEEGPSDAVGIEDAEFGVGVDSLSGRHLEVADVTEAFLVEVEEDLFARRKKQVAGGEGEILEWEAAGGDGQRAGIQSRADGVEGGGVELVDKRLEGDVAAGADARELEGVKGSVRGDRDLDLFGKVGGAAAGGTVGGNAQGG
jgi:hypothetical protein